MTVLYWLVVPLLITAIAAVWVAFAHRSRPPADPRDSMAEHERFRQAMQRQVPQPLGVPKSSGETDLSA